MLRILSFIFLLLSTTWAYAKCDFKTGLYIKELKDPSSIHDISINVPKSAKYARNIFKSISSKEHNIRPELRKRFKAEIVVNYRFGTCLFEGSVRQSGDLKDHIGFLSGGRMYRSLDVKLKKGNIASAVQFKLLIPATRNAENEILATLILKRLGIISPETFAVEVEVNGVSAPMLFQENARKELLEKNFRREGPIFEGDEELLWSFEDFGYFELVKFALSKMSNDNWFEKGSSSQAITLEAYARLQSIYSDYATNISERQGAVLFESQKDQSNFSEYMFALLAMNGRHALVPNNRKFYFNSISSRFEPIYYDGNVSFKELKEIDILDAILSAQFDSDISQILINKVNNLSKSEELKADFINRATPLNNRENIKIDFGQYYDKAIDQYLFNIRILNNKISNSLVHEGQSKKNKRSNQVYLETLKNTRFSQRIIRKLNTTAGGYTATFQSGMERKLSFKEVGRLIARNRLDGERTVFLGDYSGNVELKSPITRNVDFAEKLTFSAGMKVVISQADKTLTLTQTDQDDWVLINSADLNGWKISLNGIVKVAGSELLTDQRFNKYGLTGCLNIFNSKLDNLKINVSGGVCEDSVNIVNSKGLINSILVSRAFADALDIDFSTINVARINIDNAGNDCFDVSGGHYEIGLIDLLNCDDKGVSVGEGSILSAKKINLSGANIGVASKDLSKVEILDAEFENVAVCIEVMQKKQEFGGAFLDVGNLECDGINSVDKHSEFKVGLQ
jgi:hypothetical protein